MVQNLGSTPILLAASSTAPTTDAGLQLESGRGLSGVLAADLYARSILPGGAVLVADGVFAAGSGAAAGAASGGPAGLADFSAPANSGLIAALAA